MSRKTTSQSIMEKRWRKFKTMKRGYYSLWLLVSLYIISFLLPLLINNKPLMLKYEGELFFPVFQYHAGEKFGQVVHGEARYRDLQVTFREAGEGNWMLMPLYPYHPNESLLSELPSEPPTEPNGTHFLGTDNRGRDVFARLLYGFNITLSFALVVALFAYTIGISIGAILGFFGGKVDIIGQRFIEIFSAIPFLYTMIIISSIIQPNFFLLTLVMTCFGWMGMTYYIRGEFYREKARDYVSAAVSMGANNRRVMFRHIMPNALTPVITFMPFAVIAYIGTLVGLDFLGFGLAPPTPSWGELVNQGVADIRYWWLVVSPMAASFCTLLMITFIGEAIREAFDPKVYSRLR
ncbi:MAG: ABC transporter permease [Candidatus Delongbacteria bacterium]|nr:ABC transporter permease [Candidatus Delongbacteria bacterium]